MSERLELYNLSNLPQLTCIYNETVIYAKQVGDIDWPCPFPEQQLIPYIKQNELYGLNDESNKVISSVRLYEKSNDDPSVWHIGKLATSRLIKGTGFVEQRFFPAIIDEATRHDKKELSLTCLVRNTRLTNFYERLGFSVLNQHDARADTGETVRVNEMSYIIA